MTSDLGAEATIITGKCDISSRPATTAATAGMNGHQTHSGVTDHKSCRATKSQFPNEQLDIYNEGDYG